MGIDKMEADSTTYEKNLKAALDEHPILPFTTSPENYKLYKEFITKNGDRILESQVVERLQNFGLLPQVMKCPANKPDCKVTSRTARVVDRVQWYCEGCGKRQPIRMGSFFLRLQCTIIQALQIILAWCEDADVSLVAEHFGLKQKLVSQVYNKLDEVAVKEHSRRRLGGAGSVVLAELYPDCMNRQSPDTTDQPHRHRILMLADTNHVPTFYKLHLIKEDVKKTGTTQSNQILKSQIEDILSKSVEPGSMLVTGHSLPAIDGVYTIQQLMNCDNDMQYFLSTRIWRQATSLCAASRDLCVGVALPSLCAPAVQRYLQTALYRIRFDDGFYRHTLQKLAEEFTERETVADEI